MEALKKGNESTDPVKGKIRQLISNVAAFGAAAVVVWLRKEFPDFPLMGLEEYLNVIFIGALGAINTYFTVATSKKLGV